MEMMLDLNLLRVLDAIFAEGSVSGAARVLGLSQPGVSLALRRLREHFGDELFFRQGGAMVPTALAEQLRAPVQQMMGTLRKDIVSAGHFDPALSERCFVINMSDLGGLSFMPDLVASCAALAPGVSLQSVDLGPDELLRALTAGTIDLAIGHLIDIDTTSLFEQTLFDHEFVCLVRDGHPTIGDGLTLDQYLAADHIVVRQPGRSQERFEHRIQELGYQRRIRLQSPHFMSVPLLVAQSDMIAVVPRSVGTIYAKVLKLKILPLPFHVAPVELKQFWHRRGHADPAVIWLRKQVADLFRGRNPTESRLSPFWSHFLGSD
ncbi:LysR family transcriptional regulator [Novosphingobium terrae]|uniref:LysR family transcriptional regulator n=1 Tax=Novosphingobium terrae TaxID=2726189 RepID=UPI001F1333AF|nr:LysR family transcriptional regulator [Novosphingobium terrae]